MSSDRIIDVAREIVRTGGVDALSMRKLSAELGVAPTAIYWHVGDRRRLLDAVLEDVAGQRKHRPRILWRPDDVLVRPRRSVGLGEGPRGGLNEPAYVVRERWLHRVKIWQTRQIRSRSPA